MLTINLFRGFPTQILTLDLSFLTVFAPLDTKAVFGDGGLGLWKVTASIKGSFTGIWPCLAPWLAFGYWRFMHNINKYSWKPHTSQRQGQHFINKVKSQHCSSTWWSAVLPTSTMNDQHFTRWLSTRVSFWTGPSVYWPPSSGPVCRWQGRGG